MIAAERKRMLPSGDMANVSYMTLVGIRSRYRTPRQTDLVEKIFFCVCNEFSTTPTAMKSTTRSERSVIPRQISMYLLRKFGKLTLQEIGDKFGFRDHATVMYAVKCVKKMIDTDSDLRDKIWKLEVEIFEDNRTHPNENY